MVFISVRLQIPYLKLGFDIFTKSVFLILLLRIDPMSIPSSNVKECQQAFLAPLLGNSI